MSEKNNPNRGNTNKRLQRVLLRYNLWLISDYQIVVLTTKVRSTVKLKTNKSASKQVQSYACVDSAEREQIQQTNVC